MLFVELVTQSILIIIEKIIPPLDILFNINPFGSQICSSRLELDMVLYTIFNIKSEI